MPDADELQALMLREWQYQLERSPVFTSLMMGDRRWNDRWDDRSAEGLEGDHRHNVDVLERLQRIDRARLGAGDRLNHDLMRRDYETWRDEYTCKLHLLSTSHLGWLPEYIRQFPAVATASQLASELRFEMSRDYEDWILRLERFPEYVKQVVARMREGVREGVVHPRAVVMRIPAQIEKLLVDDATRSAFYSPFTRFPAGVPEGDRGRLAAAAERAISKGVLPALRQFLEFVTGEYVPASPETVGLWQYARGEETYAFLARKFTTTRLTPNEIHEVGLAEVERLRAEMEAVKAKVGFAGSLPAFFEFLRHDPRFYFKTGTELVEQYRNLAKRIDPLLVKLFRTLQRQPYGVEPTPEAMAPNATTGFYVHGAADGSRAGIFLVNSYKPETRPRWQMVPLTLHEAVPGHHLQVSLAAELEGIPDLRRYGRQTAYTEGWALYCETLGDELGLYDDPYDKFGQLAFDMWRAIRLVVDTGLHAKQWPRQRAIDYSLANSPQAEYEIANEVDRYIAQPGQALAYKIGQLKFRELRTRAERTLGNRFDVRAFHDLVLLGGPTPLDMLEGQVDDWVQRMQHMGQE
ncbi:DUF885 domain-containing protein [Pendulispora rubella]|uniref:DUF885 domain-containing protein n=1 Tax=Pendulispora rubella TaxID=2741070 RepID=A0ABZ2L862_9BACT